MRFSLFKNTYSIKYFVFPRKENSKAFLIGVKVLKNQYTLEKMILTPGFVIILAFTA